MSTTESERYWDERARENALFYVDTGVGYDDPDTEAFWRNGDEVVTRMTGTVGLTLSPGDTVLDIGCGVGRLTRALAASTKLVHAIDVSSEMLTLAKQHNADIKNVEWIHGDGAGLAGVDDASVDGCFSHVVFQHIPDPAVTLNYVREMGRVLRPGGWALFQVSTDPQVHRERVSPSTRVKRLLRGSRGTDRAWWGSSVHPEDLRAAADAGGMDIERLLDEGTQYTTVLARRRATA